MRRPLAAAAFLSAVLAGPCACATQEGPARAEEIRPTAAHARSARAVVEIMSRYHYRKVPLDDELGSRVLDRYLDVFDPSHSVFLAGDIADFDLHRTRVDDSLRRGRLDFAFEVFDRYRLRMGDRARLASELAAGDFDFSREEELELDRSDAPWPRSAAALDDYWRRRVKNDILELELAGHEPEAIPESLHARYSRMARRVRQIDADDVVQYFLNAYIRSIDPHGQYLSPRASENFRIRMSLSLEGIGAALQTVGEHTVVRRIIAGGPADRSGQLGVDDRIVGVRQADEREMTDIVSWRLEDVVNLIRGPKGSTVHLRILPAGAPSGPPRTLSLVRDRIDLDDQSASRRILETRASDGSPARVGVIDIPSFYLDIAGRAAGRDDFRSTSRDVRRLIGELREEGIDALVVDVRDNQGGALDEALQVAGLFIETGPIVQIRRSSGRAQVKWDEDPSVAWGGPLGVLVNRSSASASEILAGAIQDYGRGIVIGTRTFGKGTVQNVVDLPAYGGTGRLKLTISQYFRVNGEGVQRRGIEPDVDFASITAEAHTGERELENALPWARVRAAARWRASHRHDDAIAAAREIEPRTKARRGAVPHPSPREREPPPLERGARRQSQPETPRGRARAARGGTPPRRPYPRPGDRGQGRRRCPRGGGATRGDPGRVLPRGSGPGRRRFPLLPPGPGRQRAPPTSPPGREAGSEGWPAAFRVSRSPLRDRPRARGRAPRTARDGPRRALRGR